MMAFCDFMAILFSISIVCFFLLLFFFCFLKVEDNKDGVFLYWKLWFIKIKIKRML
jgi:hypothetical protein